MLLSELSVGESGIVTAMNLTKALRTRLVDMGIVCGVRVTLVRKAPFSDPLEIRVRNFNMGIRVKEAEKIEIKPVGRVKL